MQSCRLSSGYSDQESDTGGGHSLVILALIPKRLRTFAFNKYSYMHQCSKVSRVHTFLAGLGIMRHR